MKEVAIFHTLAHVFIAFTGAVLLLAIWYNIRKRFNTRFEEDNSQQRVDKGLVYLSLALFVWVGSGIWGYLGNNWDFEGSAVYLLGVNLFSTLNNLFILLALFYFSHAPHFIYNNEKNISKIIALILFVTLLTIGLNLSVSSKHSLLNIPAIPDLLASSFVCYLLSYSLYKTFVDRDLKIVAYIAVLAVALMFASQLPEVFVQLNNGFANKLIKIIAKTSLIAIFLVLATSWVIELANTPRPSEMMLEFLDWSLIKITIPSKGIYAKTIDFGSKTTQYKNLLKFALRRKWGEGQEQCILVGGAGELKNQTYLSRIIENCNRILNLPEDEKLERRDIFTFIGNGQYRLRMLPQHILIENGLLEEFSKHPDNQNYKTFCN
ncbi:hypothetical protein [Aureispira anguillae]|uniref:Uncharacterized protein n=1 Tax=Aureispira anguillae TaxID=2864201 RepID=A0A915YKT3_9BACT|nr:hypothetical protein [Aureispira anguillae]BDS14839.1 hypothetical protein AsAng_0056210 [Aureispira anguillae]